VPDWVGSLHATGCALPEDDSTLGTGHFPSVPDTEQDVEVPTSAPLQGAGSASFSLNLSSHLVGWCDRVSGESPETRARSSTHSTADDVYPLQMLPKKPP
jgi:hypothetical protein